ncbi:hypothetical protein RHSIM_Rhsim07G0060100 [Rhododendron simsii]|uniref:Uncharacterized protein n=1 Tax=Rhododendron simsii TaxID=118357 RepID=A0A834GTS1_RHOSS|nr:hypothetical protein RHSIM_Rhsim07G0060100 [Rhododendron simsii]
MLPSHCNISAAQAYEVDLADDSGIRLKSAHEFMGRQAGGMGNLDYTQQDHKNYLRSKRQTNLEYGEAEAEANTGKSLLLLCSAIRCRRENHQHILGRCKDDY